MMYGSEMTVWIEWKGFRRMEGVREKVEEEESGDKLHLIYPPSFLYPTLKTGMGFGGCVDGF